MFDLSATICEKFSRNVHDLDVDLQNSPGSNVNMANRKATCVNIIDVNMSPMIVISINLNQFNQMIL